MLRRGRREARTVEEHKVEGQWWRSNGIHQIFKGDGVMKEKEEEEEEEEEEKEEKI